MPTDYQLEKIAEAVEHIKGKNPKGIVTAGQIWDYLSTNYRRPGFKSKQAVAIVYASMKKSRKIIR